MPLPFFTYGREEYMMRILMVGDVVGKDGQDTLLYYLPKLKEKYHPDVVVVNGENSAPNGRGIKRQTVQKFFNAGADCITLGNHAWAQKEIFDFIDHEEALIRPANFPEGTPGRGYVVLSTRKGKVTIVNLLGRTFMTPMDCPFRTMDHILDKIPPSVILVDFHAEATSEKLAFACYVDGKVSSVIGTHTHVQTADERILSRGTSYLSDVGMTGPAGGVIGMEKEAVIKRFISQLPMRFEVAKGVCELNAVLVDIHAESGKSTAIERIQINERKPFFD